MQVVTGYDALCSETVFNIDRVPKTSDNLMDYLNWFLVYDIQQVIYGNKAFKLCRLMDNAHYSFIKG